MPSARTLADGSRRSELRLELGLRAAQAHRRRLRDVTFIGVTGSCGKTTTKELIAAALGNGLRGRATPAQGNGLAVVAKTILRTTRSDTFCVLEVAMAEPGSIAKTAKLIRPQIAVVTCVGTDHRSVYRTPAAISAEKRQLLEHADVAVLNADDPNVVAMAEGFAGRVVTFGTAPGATMRATGVRSSWPERLSFTLRVDGRRLPVRTQLCGRHWVTCVLAALAVARELDVPLERAAAALAQLPPTPQRMAPVELRGVTFLLDDVKAPLWAIDAALEVLAEAQAPARKVAVLGTISDYPGDASRKYVRLAKRALAAADEVVFAGPNSARARKVQSERLRVFPTVEAAAGHLRATLGEGDLVLLKGSRVDRLSRGVLDAWVG